jgi:hypothetical protein
VHSLTTSKPHPGSNAQNDTVTIRVRSVFVIAAWFVATASGLRSEIPRLQAAAKSPAGILAWFYGMNADWSLAVIVLLALPLLIIVARIVKLNAPARHSIRPKNGELQPSVLRQIIAAAALFGLSLFCSMAIGFRTVSLKPVPGETGNVARIRFCELPPAYHDEFSYLLQARTFLAGRLSWPAMTVQPDLFHQVHVLNRPTTASRYFPWTGLWMAPFTALGHPYLGHWLAGAIACVVFHRCLYRLLEFRWAVTGGALIAVSPGLASFSNLLLAHHPTLLALAIFLWAFLRLMDHYRVRDAVVAGIALSLAMLGRPMTAAGFALPFGIWLLTVIVRSLLNKNPESRTTWSPARVVAGIGVPILLGFGVLVIMNHAITGSWMKSAYQLYTDTWTPRHRYGFNNAVLDPALPESRVLLAYDQWAENLTSEKARSNVEQRTLYSLRWTLGIAALTFCIIAALPSCLNLKDPRLLLLLCSVLTLHAVHIPYWYDGIMHWHYVFETAPLLIILATSGIRAVGLVLQAQLGARLSAMWLTSLIFASLIPNWIDADTMWGQSRVTTAFQEQAFSRIRFEYFHRLTTSSQLEHPALIFVDEGSSNPQLSYIINPPDLSGDVLVCRLPADAEVVDELAQAFPGYHRYTFNPETFDLSPISPDSY